MSLGCCVWVKIEELQSQANQFKKSTVKLRKAMWWKNMKLNLIIGAVCLIIIVLVIVSKVPLLLLIFCFCFLTFGSVFS